MFCTEVAIAGNHISSVHLATQTPKAQPSQWHTSLVDSLAHHTLQAANMVNLMD